MQWQLPPPYQAGIDHPAALSGLQLAYIGDAVYELWVRSYLTAKGVVKVKDLHQRTVSFVRADTQAILAKKIRPDLLPEETDVLTRGRNAKGHAAPQGVSVQAYRQATGLEALIGWLYLSGRTDRLAAVFAALAAMMEEEESCR